MTDSPDLDQLWTTLLQRWAGFATERVPRLAESGHLIPQAWQDLTSASPADRDSILAHQWRDLPRFSSYLRASLLDLRIYVGPLGPILLYLFSDWHEQDLDRFEPGLMIAGIPEPHASVAAFEAEVGPLPSALKTVWHNHTFMLGKNGRWLASLQPAFAATFGRPTIHPRSLVGWIDGERARHDFLDLFNPGSSDISGGIVRKLGDRAWRDRVVDCEARSALVASRRETIDATLADWELSDWSS